MTYKQFKLIRLAIMFFIMAIILAAFALNNFYLAIAGIFIGALFIFLVREKFKQIVVDERVTSVAGRASRLTIVVTVFVLGMIGLFFVFSGSQKEDVFVEALGVAISYILLLMIAVYAILYRYYNKKYGGG